LGGKISKQTSFGGPVSLALCFASLSAFAATALSKAQQDVVSAQIAKLQTSEERTIASEWSKAKKVADFICRPFAMSGVKKWNKMPAEFFSALTIPIRSNCQKLGAGRLWLGTDWK
jgi:hypothetical protein